MKNNQSKNVVNDVESTKMKHMKNNQSNKNEEKLVFLISESGQYKFEIFDTSKYKNWSEERINDEFKILYNSNKNKSKLNKFVCERVNNSNVFGDVIIMSTKNLGVSNITPVKIALEKIHSLGF